MNSPVPLVFDDSNARELVTELAERLEAFGSFESVPSHIREMIEHLCAGRGFEVAPSSNATTLPTGERVICVQTGGNLCRALAALRAMQVNVDRSI